MSVYLINRNDDGLKFNNYTWAMILSLAKDYGWEPTGTVDPWKKDEPAASDWSGSYISLGFQWVTSDDAANIANALERAIEKMDDTSVIAPEDIAIASDFRGVIEGMEQLTSFTRTHSVIIKGYLYKQMLKKFIQFCQKGSFCIS